MKKRNLLAFLIAGTCALTCATVGAWALDTEKVNAAYTNEGGVDHYTDMTSNGVDLEYYDRCGEHGEAGCQCCCR